VIVAALEAGLTLAEFWRSTPRQSDYAVRAYHRRRGWLAWHVAVLGRVEQFPDLSELTGEPVIEPDEEAAAEVQVNNTRAWNSVMKSLPRIAVDEPKDDPECPA
jgi:hypothetical protein